MRLSRAGACFVVAGIYLVLRITIPMMRIGFLNSMTLVVSSIALMMLVQLALAVTIGAGDSVACVHSTRRYSLGNPRVKSRAISVPVSSSGKQIGQRRLDFQQFL